MEFDFEQNVELDTLDLVPENFRGAYIQDPATKKFTINDAAKGLVSAVTGLNKALKGERNITTTLKSQKDIASVVKETFGLDTIDEVKAKIEELNNQVIEKSKIDPAKIKADIEKTYTAKETELVTKNQNMFKTVEKYLIDAEGNAALNELKGNAKLLLPIIKAQTKVVEDGDNYVVRILDAQGDYRGNGMGGFMTVADYVKELKASPDYAIAFASDAPSGHGKQQIGVPSRQSATQQGNAPQGQMSNGDKSPLQKITDGLRASKR